MKQAILVLGDGKKEMENFDFFFGIACDETEGEGYCFSVEISKMFDIFSILNNG